ncbi:MAG: LLM class flavin-dependent oxidoreductase [Gammaproteobacteria bacterium]|nr:LLM class flavin-dependent oxidoreductase [Gammaproteobacteria bacterium]
MRFGLRLIGYAGGVRRQLQLARLGEEAGFDSIWFPHDTFMYNTWVLASAVAAGTSRIHIGSVGTNPYTTDPSEIATFVSTLDELCGGRCILGLGLHTTEMVEWLGIKTAGYIERTREATRIVRSLLRGETVRDGGPEFQWGDQCYLRFKPLRSNVPIYIAAFGADYLELAGEIGDGCLPMLTPPESTAYMVSAIRRGAARSGRKMGDFVISGCAWLSLSETRRAASEVMKKMAAYFGPYLEEPALNNIGLAVRDFLPLKELVRAGRLEEACAKVTEPMLRIGITGTPGDVINCVERLGEAGINEVNLGGPLGPDPEEAIRLMGAKVIPYFK